jgi:hypothetical protein
MSWCMCDVYILLLQIFEASSGQLLHSSLCPSYLKAVACDPAENFLFMGSGTGVIHQVYTVILQLIIHFTLYSMHSI